MLILAASHARGAAPGRIGQPAAASPTPMVLGPKGRNARVPVTAASPLPRAAPPLALQSVPPAGRWRPGWRPGGARRAARRPAPRSSGSRVRPRRRGARGPRLRRQPPPRRRAHGRLRAGRGRPRRGPAPPYTGPAAWQAAAAALAVWAVTGARSLHHEAERAWLSLHRHDLASAREVLPSLCGRDPAQLDARQITRAVIESVAENTSDAVVAPLLWGAVAGIPGWSPTARSIRSTRWSATVRPGTCGSAGPRPAWTTWPTGFRPGSPPR